MKEKEIYMNNMVTLDKIPYTRPIVVGFDGELKGIVCKSRCYENIYQIRWVTGLYTKSFDLPQLIKSWQKEGYTFKTQFSPGGPLREITTDDSWVNVDDIKSTDLVLVKKSGNIIGMVQFHNGDYFVSTGIDVWEQDLGYCSSKQSLIERGNERGYSFFLQVNDTQ